MTVMAMLRSKAAWAAVAARGGQGDFASAFSDVFDDSVRRYDGRRRRGGGRARHTRVRPAL